MSYTVIRSYAAMSALGANEAQTREAYRLAAPRMVKRVFGNTEEWVAPLAADAENKINGLLQAYPRYAAYDRTVCMSIPAAEEAWRQTGWTEKNNFLINASSSRGATGLWERYHAGFTAGEPIPVKTSPTTTLGNLATNIARHLDVQAATIEHSITCGSGLQALGNAMAWLRSGMAERAMVTAAEAPLTAFTIAQMKALGIYSRNEGPYPCTPFSAEEPPKNSMVLGEAAVALCMEQYETLQPGDIYIRSIGFGLEKLRSLTSIDPEGAGFRQSMQAALQGIPPEEFPSAIIAHAPGTVQGDRAEMAAIRALYQDDLPVILSNKWLAGHCLGASGLLSVEWAIYLLNGAPPVRPAYELPYAHGSAKIKHILINAMGFGGNAISVILSKY